MAGSDAGETGKHDPSVGAIDAIDDLDIETLSYIQLRRLYATLMRAVDNVSEELTARSEEDNAGDTVRVPVPSSQ